MICPLVCRRMNLLTVADPTEKSSARGMASERQDGGPTSSAQRSNPCIRKRSSWVRTTRGSQVGTAPALPLAATV